MLKRFRQWWNSEPQISLSMSSVMERLETILSSVDASLERLTEIQQGTNNLLASLDEDHPTVLRRLMSIENKVDRLLEEGSESE
jgi:hypothetical protein